MVYTFYELQRQVLRFLDEEDNTTTRTLVKDLLNQAHQSRCREARWPFMLSKDYTLSAGAHMPNATLHPECDRLFALWDSTGRALEEIPFRQLHPEQWRQTEGGTAAAFALMGTWAVKAQPALPSPVTVVSSAPTDTGSSYNLAIKGEDAEGNVVVDVVTPNGTTPVTSATTFTHILAITRSAQTEGVLTFTYSDATSALTLQPWEMGKAFPVVTFYPTPATASTFTYRFYRQPLVLVNDYDIPELPSDHAQLLVWDVLVLLAGYVSDIPPTAIADWRMMQAKGERELWQAYMDGQTLATRTKTIRYMGDA